MISSMIIECHDNAVYLEFKRFIKYLLISKQILTELFLQLYSCESLNFSIVVYISIIIFRYPV